MTLIGMSVIPGMWGWLLPGSVAKLLRVPWPDVLPPGRLATEVLDPALLTRGLATQDDLYPPADQSALPGDGRGEKRGIRRRESGFHHDER